jgi:hypothetical protein
VIADDLQGRELRAWLIARGYLVPTNATPEERQRQAALLAELNRDHEAPRRHGRSVRR